MFAVVWRRVVGWRRAPYLFTGLILALQIGAILRLNEGRLTYTLDDAYIHLAVSETLAEGRYGIHPSATSAPSSSFLWPFLLVLGTPLPWHEALPLLLNLGALMATLGLLDRVICHSGLHRVPGGSVFAAGLLALLALTLNLTGLVLTGMEHSLQVALAVTVVLGMICVDRGQRPSAFLWMAMVAGPLVRYESLALSLAAVLLLVMRGYFRQAVIAGLSCLALLGLFSGFLLDRGLEPLPGPVMESFQGGDSSHLSLPVMILQRLKAVIVVLPARILALFAGALIAVALVSRRDKTLLFCGSLVPVLHLIFGSCRGFARYEIYALVSVATLLIYGLRQPLRALVNTRGATVSLLAIGAVLIPAFSGYAAIAYRSPRAAHNIYQQQHQMHRFITEHYRKPVAVNDLGRVSFENPFEVLDLWGLSSAEVRQARLNRNSDWPAAFVDRRGVDLAMIYDSWFKDRIPTDWRRIAVLHLRGKRITPSSSAVSFYLTRPGPVGDLADELRRFGATLPADTELVMASALSDRPKQLETVDLETVDLKTVDLETAVPATASAPGSR